MKPPLTTTALALVVGLLVLFFGHIVPGIQQFDRACIHFRTNVTELFYGQGLAKNQPPVEAKKNEERYRVIAITDDPDQIFEKSPPSPLDYAVILDTLLKQGDESVVLATRMVWDDATDMEMKALEDRMALFRQCIISLPVTRGAQKAPLPELLERSIIPHTNIKGSYKTLPTVNQTTLPDYPTGAGQTYAGFSHIESEASPDKNYIQMLAQWQGEHSGQSEQSRQDEKNKIIPSIELLILMSYYNLKPSEIVVHSGQHIQLKPDGVIIPIDEYGRTLVTSEKPLYGAPPHYQTTPAESLLRNRTAPITANPSRVTIIQATGQNSLSTNNISIERLQELIIAAPYLTNKNTAIFTRIHISAEVALILNIGLFIYIVLGVKTRLRHFLFLLLLISLIAALVLLFQILGNWLLPSAPLATILTAWLLQFFYKSPTAQN